MEEVASDRSWERKEGRSWARNGQGTEQAMAWNPGSKALVDGRTYTKLHNGKWGNTCKE